MKETSNSLTEITKIIGVHRFSIRRELKRNSESKSYSYIAAQNKLTTRRLTKSISKPVLSDLMLEIIELNLKHKWWSPQQIA